MRLIETLTLDVVLREINGWLFPSEAQLLSNMAFQVPFDGVGEGVIVELGSYQGRSTLSLLHGCANRNVKVYSVDPRKNWEGEPDHFHTSDLAVMLNNLKTFEVEDLVVPITQEGHIVGKGWGLMNKPVDLIFIDGCHLEECVTRDIEAWLPNMKSTGIMAFHDANTPGIENSIAKFPELTLVAGADITKAYGVRKNA